MSNIEQRIKGWTDRINEEQCTKKGGMMPSVSNGKCCEKKASTALRRHSPVTQPRKLCYGRGTSGTIGIPLRGRGGSGNIGIPLFCSVTDIGSDNEDSGLNPYEIAAFVAATAMSMITKERNRFVWRDMKDLLIGIWD